MKKNMGLADRIIRLAVVVLIAVLYFTGVLNLTWTIILGVVALIFLVTGLVGTCPLYMPFGISTRKKSEN
jgi:hypothetical protein